MTIGYDKQAIVEYVESMEKDETFAMLMISNVLEPLDKFLDRFMRLYTEIKDEADRNRAKLYEAQEEKARAENDLDDAQNYLNSSNNDAGSSEAYNLMQNARQRIAEADKEIEFYSKQCEKFEMKLRELNALRNNYMPQAAKAKNVLEDDLDSLKRSFNDASVGLYNFMRTMEMAKAILYDSEVNGTDISNFALPKGAKIFDKPARENLFLPAKEPANTNVWAFEKNGDVIIGNPENTGNQLISNQGRIDGFKGTCGLCSVANVVLLSGNPASERNMVDVASAFNLCTHTSVFSSNNGSTSAQDRKALLEKFGISSMLIPQCERNGLKREYQTDLIADYVSKGHGVILSVHASKLYKGWTLGGDYHAVTVTGVKKDSFGNVQGFYICDSNSRPCSYYTTEQLEGALTKHNMNVTTEPIRAECDSF